MNIDYTTVTEMSGEYVSVEQIERLCNRYYWAGNYCKGKDIVEVACGTGQGLGYLSTLANSIQGGDCSKEILEKAHVHYEERIFLRQFDAQKMPIKDNSKDVVILFEAIYYLPEVEKFIKEAKRILRPKGIILIATANKDLYDFNPSPYSIKYFGVVELNNLFKVHGFDTEFYGNASVEGTSTIQKILRPVKKIAVTLHLVPQTMRAKKLLKRVVFGKLIKMPAEITRETAPYIEPVALSPNIPDKQHKVIYCIATLEK